MSGIYRYLYRLCVICLNIRYLYLIFRWDNVLELVIHLLDMMFRYIIYRKDDIKISLCIISVCHLKLYLACQKLFS